MDFFLYFIERIWKILNIWIFSAWRLGFFFTAEIKFIFFHYERKMHCSNKSNNVWSLLFAFRACVEMYFQLWRNWIFAVAVRIACLILKEFYARTVQYFRNSVIKYGIKFYLNLLKRDQGKMWRFQITNL